MDKRTPFLIEILGYVKKIILQYILLSATEGAVVCSFAQRGPAWLEPSSIPSREGRFLPDVRVDVCEARCTQNAVDLPCAALALAEDGCWLLPYEYDEYLSANRIVSSADFIFYTPDCYGTE